MYLCIYVTVCSRQFTQDYDARGIFIPNALERCVYICMYIYIYIYIYTYMHIYMYIRDCLLASIYTSL